MKDAPFPAKELTPEQQAQWLAEVTALRDYVRRKDVCPLRMGDRFNEMKARWGAQMPLLARATGVRYHIARQRAHISERIPPDSRLRALELPYSILRMLAPVADLEYWAEQARALDVIGELHVREFTHVLEEGGARRRRGQRKRARCIHCGGAIAEGGVFFRCGESAGWLCRSGCAAEYFQSRGVRDA